jgi:DNA gyrase inhibitor GyrI
MAQKESVRIVRLEPMRVASALGFGSSPEMMAWEKIIAFAQENGLLDKADTRYFGFNNPSPSPGSPNYGYEQWVTVGPLVAATADVAVKEFGGGLYGVLRCEGIPQIGACWKELVTWFENSHYQHGAQQWLEEALTPPGTPEEAMVLDLYLPLGE